MHFGHFGKHSTMNGTTTSISGGRTQGTVDVMPFRLYDDGNYVEPAPIVFVSQPPKALTCQTSKEIKTVPSESGGTRDTLQSPAADLNRERHAR